MFLISRLDHIRDLFILIYRDDVLAATRRTKRQQGEVREDMIVVFNENGWSITISTDLRKVDFLDVTLDLREGTYKPLKTAVDRPLYVHLKSNQPTQVIKNIPRGFERRLSMLGLT